MPALKHSNLTSDQQDRLLKAAMAGYEALLTHVTHSPARLHIQGELVSLRSAIAAATGESDQEVQDSFEERALYNRMRLYGNP